MIGAIVLAAGASARMGKPKALLRIGDKTFVHHIVDVLHSAGVQDVVIVLGSEADRIKKLLGGIDGSVVINEAWRLGQLSSIIKGLDAISRTDIEAIIICPVDHPLISQRLIEDLLSAFRKSHKNIVVPVYKEKRGHPVIFSRSMFEEIRKAPINIGAREVLRNHSHDIVEVDTDEKGVLSNIDTLPEYLAMIV
jgi:molybdenum cofactor cytidylyltransferase